MTAKIRSDLPVVPERPCPDAITLDHVVETAGRASQSKNAKAIGDGSRSIKRNQSGDIGTKSPLPQILENRIRWQAEQNVQAQHTDEYGDAKSFTAHGRIPEVIEATIKTHRLS